MKLTKKLLCLAFLLLILLVPLLTIFTALRSPSGWSAQENRALAGKPELSVSALWTGATAAQTESFLKDHLVGRSALLKLDVWFQMRVLRRPVVSDVVLGDDPAATRWRSEFLYSRAATIYGGSAEIQRNIVARRLLDLGARHVDVGQTGEESWIPLVDPAGNEFCVLGTRVE